MGKAQDYTGGPVPRGAIVVGSKIMYPGTSGTIHPTAADVLRQNQAMESDFSRGAGGGCPQRPDSAPGGKKG